MRLIKYSIVIPIYNEQDNIKPLNKELIKILSSNNLEPYEIIYIEDGSTDNSLEELKSLKNIKIIELNRNYGQSVALDAGFKASQGEIIISLDGDLQNDPADIPKLLDKLQKDNLDVVAGWRKNRQDSNGIRTLTLLGRFTRRILIRDPVHDTGCTLRVYKREAVKSLDLWGEMHRYILALLRWKGFKIGELEVNHRPRKHGKTKYGIKKASHGLIDLIYIWFINKFSHRPLHMFGALGLFFIFLGILATGWMILEKAINNIDLSSNAWFVLGFFLMLMGIQFFTVGIILDLQLRSYFNTSSFEKRYYVKEVIES